MCCSCFGKKKTPIDGDNNSDDEHNGAKKQQYIDYEYVIENLVIKKAPRELVNVVPPWKKVKKPSKKTMDKKIDKFAAGEQMKPVDKETITNQQEDDACDDDVLLEQSPSNSGASFFSNNSCDQQEHATTSMLKNVCDDSNLIVPECCSSVDLDELLTPQNEPPQNLPSPLPHPSMRKFHGMIPPDLRQTIDSLRYFHPPRQLPGLPARNRRNVKEYSPPIPPAPKESIKIVNNQHHKRYPHLFSTKFGHPNAELNIVKKNEQVIVELEPDPTDNKSTRNPKWKIIIKQHTAQGDKGMDILHT